MSIQGRARARFSRSMLPGRVVAVIESRVGISKMRAQPPLICVKCSSAATLIPPVA